MAQARSVEVPHTELDRETLRRLVEEYVSRDGTDYGRRERTLEEKVEDVLRQLRRGEVCIVFDPESQTTNLVASRDLRRSAPS
jgi:uncharacterized protein YheU (UPF0270 family)